MRDFSQIVILGNGAEWCERSLNKLIKMQNVSFFNKRLPINNELLLQIARIHYSYKINEYVNLPFKNIWYKKFAKDLGLDKNASQSILILYDRNILGGEQNFLEYIKKNYPNTKLIYMFTNIVKFTGAQEKNYVHHLKKWYDIVFAFDPIDAQKYGFEYSPLIYDADEKYINKNKKYVPSNIFYVGQAKDRLNLLISTFEKLKLMNIKLDFNIVKVPEEKQKYCEEITYNKLLSYDEVLHRINNSTCLVDIIQGESAGLTIKNCEAICYNKKLITTNKHIKDYPFFDSRFIRVIESINDIDLDFFEQNTEVFYEKENDYFSAQQFLNRLSKVLNKKQ